MNSNNNNFKSKILRYIYKEEYVREIEEKLAKRKEEKEAKKKMNENDLTIKEIVLGIIAFIVITVLVIMRFFT